MTITPSYIPSGSQTVAQAQARAQALGVGLASPTVPPVYQQAVNANGGVPGVVAEYGQNMVVFAHDDGTLTPAQVSTLIAPLQTAQTNDQQLSANQQTIQANILNRQSQIQAWIAAHPTGATLTASQTLTLAQMLNGLCQLMLQQFNSTNLT